MTIKYHWENVRVNEFQEDTLEPKTRPVIRDIDYVFEVEIKDKDISDYGIVGLVDLEELENDDDFIEFMKDRYEDVAYEEWENSNGIY